MWKDTDHESRFFRSDDPIVQEVGGARVTAWSRFYEYRWALDAAHRYFGDCRDKVCLDAGSRVKPFTSELAERFKKVIAVDTNPEVLVVDNRVEFHQGKIERFRCLPLDAIFCISVLEHMDQYKLDETMGNFNILLKIGGCLVLTFDFPRVNLDRVHWSLANNRFVVRAWNTQRADRLLTGATSLCPNPKYAHLNVFRAFAVKEGNIGFITRTAQCLLSNLSPVVAMSRPK